MVGLGKLRKGGVLMTSAKRICFICLGNIIRSPLAQHLFSHKASEAGVADKYQVSSAGLGPWHVGEQPDSRMRRIASKRGIHMSGRAREFSPSEFEQHDLILVMDSENLQRLKALTRNEEQRRKIRMLREFDPDGGKHSPVPDPYYGGPNGFEEVYQIIDRSVEGLLEQLENEQVEQE
jgi:protein-tyrosine phosphatase